MTFSDRLGKGTVEALNFHPHGPSQMITLRVPKKRPHRRQVHLLLAPGSVLLSDELPVKFHLAGRAVLVLAVGRIRVILEDDVADLLHILELHVRVDHQHVSRRLVLLLEVLVFVEVLLLGCHLPK